MPGIAAFLNYFGVFFKSVSMWVTSYGRYLEFVPVLEKAIKMYSL